MVKSGLADRPDVSAYRLSAHLGLALSIYGYGLWLALGLLGAGAGWAMKTFMRSSAHGQCAD